MNLRSVFQFTLIGMINLVPLAQGDWPQYRGPSASGLDERRSLPTSWNAATGENILWHTPIPGLAHSSPIVASNRIYLTTAVSPTEASLRVGLYGDIESVDESEPQEWRLLALERDTGKILWNTLAVKAVPRVKRHTKTPPLPAPLAKSETVPIFLSNQPKKITSLPLSLATSQRKVVLPDQKC